MQVSQSRKLANVCYDIRGPVLEHATRLEEEGHRILKLNIGNPAPFGFDAPEEILQDVIRGLPNAQGYCDSKGLLPAGAAVVQYHQRRASEHRRGRRLPRHAFRTHVMAMQAMLDDGDEVSSRHRLSAMTAAVSLPAEHRSTICATRARTGSRSR